MILAVFTPGRYARLESCYVLLNQRSCVKAKVKSHFLLLCISLRSESWNDSRKISRDLKTILIKTDFATLRFLELWEGQSMLINLNYVAWENSLKLTWSKKDRLCVKLLFTWRIKNLLVLKYFLAYLGSSVKTTIILTESHVAPSLTIILWCKALTSFCSNIKWGKRQEMCLFFLLAM